jgi:hypothetical protein
MEASLELSNVGNSEPPPPPFIIEEEGNSTKTRKWGNVLHKNKVTSKKNLLSAVVEGFFWPFQSPLKAGFVVKLDFMVTARLLMYLGKVVSLVPLTESKCRMVEALAEAVWVHRWSKQSHIVRSCMICLTESLISFEADVLVEQFSSIVDESINWFTTSARNATDKETADVSRSCASELALHLNNASIVETQKEFGI